MGDLKNNLSTDKTVSLSATDIHLLDYIHATIQSDLDRLQQQVASGFLQHLAVTKFGFSADQNLQFNFDPAKEEDNLTIKVVE